MSWQALDTIAGIRLFFPALKAIKHNWALLDRKVNLKNKPSHEELFVGSNSYFKVVDYVVWVFVCLLGRH